MKPLIYSINVCFHLFVPYRELVSLLHSRDIDVYLVSGGFYTVIEPVAKELHIPVKNIFANRLKFYFDGKFQIVIAHYNSNCLNSS